MSSQDVFDSNENVHLIILVVHNSLDPQWNWFVEPQILHYQPKLDDIISKWATRYMCFSNITQVHFKWFKWLHKAILFYSVDKRDHSVIEQKTECYVYSLDTPTNQSSSSESLMIYTRNVHVKEYSRQFLGWRLLEPFWIVSRWIYSFYPCLKKEIFLNLRSFLKFNLSRSGNTVNELIVWHLQHNSAFIYLVLHWV
jgi:hypothetical protein